MPMLEVVMPVTQVMMKMMVPRTQLGQTRVAGRVMASQAGM